MKFVVTMKDPDTLDDSISHAVDVSLMGVEDKDEREAVKAVRHAKVREVADTWFRYGEYLSVEIDTDTGTATVLKANE